MTINAKTNWSFMLTITKTSVVFLILVAGILRTSSFADQPWKRHTIDDSLQGADGVRLADFNHDGLMDVVTGWEESGIVKLYLNPGTTKSKQLWPQAIIGEGKSPEDAVPFDVDGNGTFEVVSCHEGGLKQVLVHTFVAGGSADEAYSKVEPMLERTNWKTTSIGQVDGQQWMFAMPIKLNNGKHGLIVGSKGKNATLTFLSQSKSGPAEIENWNAVKLRDCGWIMSIQSRDMDDDGDNDIVFSDRKSETSAVAWLEQPDENADKNQWTEHIIGATETEPMFIDATPGRVLVSTRQMAWIDFRKNESGAWDRTQHQHPSDVPFGKAIRALKKNTIVLTANTHADKSPIDRPGIWLQKPDATWHPIDATTECKFDRIELIDLDGDGDLDVLTCEERQQLGVVWYENPGIK